MASFPDWFRRLRVARLRASIHEDLDPAEVRAINALTRDKQLAVVGLISAYAQIRADTTEDQFMDMAADLIPDVNDMSAMGAAAVHNAHMNVIFYLLRELARERGERVEQVWQRAAAELTRQASGE